MSQIEEEVFEFEDDMTSQVAEEEAAAERVAEVKESDPDQMEAATEEEKPEVEEPVKTDTEVETTTTEKDEWTLTAVMDEREKRQKAVEKAEKLQQKLDALENPEEEVSIFENEAEWKAKQDEKVKQEVRNVSLNMSQAFAEETFGEDKVAAATKWMQDEGVKSPYIVNEFNSAKLPFHKLVKLHEAEQVRLNPEAYKAELKAQILKELKEANPPKEPEPTITQSLASKRSAGEPSKFPDNPEDILGE